MKPTCPKCSGVVVARFDCHTYPGGNYDDGRPRFMHCLDCASAVAYECVNDDWYYVDGLNQDNPRAQHNETKRPDWLERHELWKGDDGPYKHPDVLWSDEHDDAE